MEKYIADNLHDNEKILWLGRPQKIKLLEAPFKAGIIAAWFVSVVCVGFGIWYWNYAATHGLSINRAYSLVIFMCAAAVLIAVNPLIAIRKLQRNCLYCVTTRRVMICFKGEPCEIKSCDLSSVDEIVHDVLDTGCGTIYIGEKTPKAARTARNRSLYARMDDEGLPLTFYSVEDSGAVCEYLKTGQKNK